jgi:cytochrome b involved in lipid metabolism
MDLPKLHNTKKVVYSRNEVAQHTREGDIWVIIENDVYDLSQFLHEHPGGVEGNLFSCESTV